MNYRAFAILVAFLVGLVAWSGVAQAEEISGNVFFDDFSGGTVNQWDPGLDMPVPFEVIFVRQLDAPPGGGFETATFTDDMGFYTVNVPPGRYELVVPGFATPGVGTGFKMYAPGVAGDPPTPLPSGVTVMPGDNPTVDLPFLQGPGPAFANEVAPDVPAAMVSFNPDIPPANFPKMNRSNFGSSESPQNDTVGADTLVLGFLTGVEITMTPIDQDGNATGPAVLATPLSSSTPGAFFHIWPALTDGDTVRFEIDPAQAALDGFGPVTSTSVDVTYTAGETLPPIEFRLKPAKDIVGTAFQEFCSPNGVFDGTDQLLANVPVELFDFEAAAGDPPIATTTTDADGAFVFENVILGIYRVRAEPVGATALEQARVILGDVDPAPVNFAFGATTHRVDLELCFDAIVKDKQNTLHVLFQCDGLTDVLVLKFDGNSWTGTANGKRGVLSASSVELSADGTQWKALVSVRARDMSDGGVGAFPGAECPLKAHVNGRQRRLTLDFRECIDQGAVTDEDGNTLHTILKVLHLLN